VTSFGKISKNADILRLSWSGTGILARLQGGPAQSKPLPNYQKIVLKHAIKIRFSRQLKVLTKYHNIICWHYILCVTDFVTSLAMPDPRSSDMRHI